MKYHYGRGSAAAYQAWLEKQTPEVHRVASTFRPWEIYKLQGREIYVRIVDYQANETNALLAVEREDGVRFSVTPGQIDLFGLVGDELPDERLYRAVDEQLVYA